MASPVIGFTSNNQNSIDISKMMNGARLIYTTFRMGIGNLRQISVTVNTNADPTQLRNQKKLIDCPELDEIRSQDAKLRRYVELKACRFTMQEGVLIIADGMIPIVDRVLVAYEMIRRPALVEKFMESIRLNMRTTSSKPGSLWAISLTRNNIRIPTPYVRASLSATGIWTSKRRARLTSQTRTSVSGKSVSRLL